MTANETTASRKRGAYKHRPKPLGNADQYVDYVSRAGVKPTAVGSEDRHNPQISIVQTQLGSNRQPYNPDAHENRLWHEWEPEIKLVPSGKKYCIHCGEWVKFEGFSPNVGNHDKLQSWCKVCRAEHARKIYWAAKHTGVQKAA